MALGSLRQAEGDGPDRRRLCPACMYVGTPPCLGLVYPPQQPGKAVLKLRDWHTARGACVPVHTFHPSRAWRLWIGALWCPSQHAAMELLLNKCSLAALGTHMSTLGTCEPLGHASALVHAP